jgi:hypothetical protein
VWRSVTCTFGVVVEVCPAACRMQPLNPPLALRRLAQSCSQNVRSTTSSSKTPARWARRLTRVGRLRQTWVLILTLLVPTVSQELAKLREEATELSATILQLEKSVETQKLNRNKLLTTEAELGEKLHAAIQQLDKEHAEHSRTRSSLVTERQAPPALI